MNEVAVRRNPLRDAPLWVHGLAWGVFSLITLVLLVLYWLYRDTDVWFHLLGDTAPTQHAFAELVRGNSIFRTPANTWSNLGFVLVGLYILAYSFWDLRRETSAQDPYAVRHPALMILFGLTCVELGFGSGFMHASLTSWGHKADVFGMYSTLCSLMALQCARWIPEIPLGSRRIPSWPFLGFTAVAASVLLLLNIGTLGGDVIMYALILLVGFTTTAERFFSKSSFQVRWLVIGFVSLGIAYYIWRLDVARQFSAPDAWIQGHAIWHVLTAVPLGCMAIYYRTEAPANTTDAA